jgi:hypothetical protein
MFDFLGAGISKVSSIVQVESTLLSLGTLDIPAFKKIELK